MGILGKLEDKLTGSHKHEDQNRLQKESEAGGHHGRHEAEGYAGQQMMGDNTPEGRTHDLRHPIQSATSRTHGEQYGNMPAAGSGSASSYADDGYGSQPNTNKMLPQEPYDPHTIKGQNIAANAASRDHHGHHGTGMTGGRSGQHNDLENPSAIPYAGNERVGESGMHPGYNDQHHHGRDAAMGAGAAGVGAHEMNKHHGHHSGHDTGRSSHEANRHHNGRHEGRDAALAGGAGAAGIGAYESGKHHNTHHPGREAARHHNEPHMGRDAALAGGAYETDNHHHNHHHGRDTAFDGHDNDRHHNGQHIGRDAVTAGGLGAAGVGAYEANKHHRDHRGDTGPASNTIGPHSNNMANVVDPRVKPQPDQMKDRTTAGPHKSDMLNKLDPRVESNPAKAHEQGQHDHHYGRDAAVAGGLGSAGAGAYEHEKHHGQHHQGGLPHRPHEGASNTSYGQPQGQGAIGGGSGTGLTASGLPTEKKLGGAYEAGYRDAMAHIEAERK
ncbi:hypothetical protein BAUCODRAFT_30578 [Baudoinia panamericana UAMH 10762]|uniref:Uncharacterized protein n=1 Tax=Baudoinia panamericana (strain UAMH 10762) TaxID=717646 RepID=M2MTA5_BAUPA|nr:uncharacterized protein BAUCODRAFT_30578 [Baudoinia panamericana UAMH 10762]EMD00117.1 hypothetical protein BAUCODRAFT_30578 [Baudoinia panamericana UAMH 10762]